MSYFTEVLADNPLAYWRLGETTGTVAADASGYGRNATYQNGPALAEAGALGSDPDPAVRLDGSNDRLDLSGVPALGTSFSIELWLKWDAGADSYQTLIGQAGGSFSLFLRSDGRLDLFYSDTDHHFTPALQAGAWQYVVVAVSAGTATCYLNGIALGTAAGVPSGFQPDRMGDNTAGDSFKGWLDEVALYPAALSQARIAAHYSAAYRGLLNLTFRLRGLLKDADAAGYRWTDEELRRHLRRAIDELSQVWPDERTTSLTATPGSRDLPLSALDQLIDVEAVEYPAGLYPASYVPFQSRGGTLSLLIDRAPAAAESVTVHWSGRHQVELKTSTLPLGAEEVVLTGAAAYAAEAWSSYATNRANVGGSQAVDDYRELGRVWLLRFQDDLRRHGRAARVRTASLYTPVHSGPRETVQWP